MPCCWQWRAWAATRWVVSLGTNMREDCQGHTLLRLAHRLSKLVSPFPNHSQSLAYLLWQVSPNFRKLLWQAFQRHQSCLAHQTPFPVDQVHRDSGCGVCTYHHRPPRDLGEEHPQQSDSVSFAQSKLTLVLSGCSSINPIMPIRSTPTMFVFSCCWV